jgi:LCP family protein required for cell wall assembly
MALTAGLGAYVLVRQIALASPLLLAGTGPLISNPQVTPTSPGDPPSTLEDTGPLGDQPDLTPWDGAGRVTVLLLGLDYRDWESGSEASRSDTMILLTLDPLTRTAGILSVPRDTWVPIPGFTHGKINTAYYLGDAYQLPGGGPGLAVKTVEQFLGVPINYYAQIDFAAFVRFIDEIGGVKIDVPEAITIDLLGDGRETIKTLQPGVQVLPGEWALAYARNRKTQEGDFDRARRQQQVILGIRDRLLSPEALLAMIQKAPTLYKELASGIRTNLSVDDVIRLALLANEVPGESIKQGVLGTEYTIFGRSPDNLSINIPIPDKIQLLRDEIFATSGALGPLTPGGRPEQMIAEAAQIGVYNSSNLEGLETSSADYLRAHGAQVAEQGPAGQQYARTTLIDHTGNPYTLRYLAEAFFIQPEEVVLEYDPGSSIDIELYLGFDAEGIDLH